MVLAFQAVSINIPSAFEKGMKEERELLLFKISVSLSISKGQHARHYGGFAHDHIVIETVVRLPYWMALAIRINSSRPYCFSNTAYIMIFSCFSLP